MTTRARAIHLKHQNQHLLCKAEKIDLNRLALNRLSKIRLFSSKLNPRVRCAFGNVFNPMFCSGEVAYILFRRIFFSKKKLSIFSSRDVAKMFLWQSCLCSILKNCPPHPSIPPRVCKLTACVCRTQTLPGKGNHFLNWKWNIIFWWTPCEKKLYFLSSRLKKTSC